VLPWHATRAPNMVEWFVDEPPNAVSVERNHCMRGETILRKQQIAAAQLNRCVVFMVFMFFSMLIIFFMLTIVNLLKSSCFRFLFLHVILLFSLYCCFYNEKYQIKIFIMYNVPSYSLWVMGGWNHLSHTALLEWLRITHSHNPQTSSGHRSSNATFFFSIKKTIVVMKILFLS